MSIAGDYYSRAALPSGAPSEPAKSGSDLPRHDEDRVKAYLQSPGSPPDVSIRHTSTPSSLASPRNHGSFPTSPGLVSELSGEPSPVPELSPDPQRSSINRSPRVISHAEVTNNQSQTSKPVKDVEESRMRPNLGVSGDEGPKRSEHVMSWMSHQNGDAGPAR